MGEHSGRAYRRQRQKSERFYVMCCLSPEAWLAVCRVMDKHEISASGALHHLARVAAGLDPLLPS